MLVWLSELSAGLVAGARVSNTAAISISSSATRFREATSRYSASSVSRVCSWRASSSERIFLFGERERERLRQGLEIDKQENSQWKEEYDAMKGKAHSIK